jgi:hypothetical protein
LFLLAFSFLSTGNPEGMISSRAHLLLAAPARLMF